MARSGIIAAGCWTLDRIKIVDRWPDQESLGTILSTDQQGGGSAHNLGIDIAKLDPDIPVYAIGKVGVDEDARFLIDTAVEHGVDIRQLHRCSAANTSFTDVISVADTGKRTFFHHAGTNDLLTPDDFDFSQCNAKIAHFGLPGLHAALDNPTHSSDTNGWVTVLKKAQAADIKTNLELVSIEPERIRTICLPCLRHLDYLIVNDQEIGSLANLTTVADGKTDMLQCEVAAKRALEIGSMQLVAVHYPGGAVVVTRSGETHRVSAAVIAADSIVGAVGAGDAFAAGMLYGLHEEWPLIDSVKLGHATAAASLRSATTVGAVESVDAVLALAGFSRPN